MRRWTASLVVGLVLLAGGAARAEEEAFAVLLGANEVPPVRTEGFAIAYLYVPDEGSFIYWFLLYSDLEGRATEANIHFGAEGEIGPILFGLRGIPGGTSGVVDGFLSERDLRPTREIQTFEQAIGAILRGRTYVNLASSAYLRGEVRGQTFRLE